MSSTSISRRTLFVLLLAVGSASFFYDGAFAQTDPLPSWTDGAVKKSITDFVARVTAQGGPDFVPPAERIATFDNDGTLWCEQPYYFQLAFALDQRQPVWLAVHERGQIRVRQPVAQGQLSLEVRLVTRRFALGRPERHRPDRGGEQRGNPLDA